MLNALGFRSDFLAAARDRAFSLFYSVPFSGLKNRAQFITAARNGDNEASQLLRSYILMKGFHSDTKPRRNGDPFITHTNHVGDVMLQKFGIYGAIIGRLHDVLEDNPELSVEDLKKYNFPEFIYDALETLTKREDESYAEYIERIAHSAPAPDGINYALETKLIDMQHNYDSDLELMVSGRILEEKHIEKHEFYKFAMIYLNAIKNGDTVNGIEVTPTMPVRYFAYLHSMNVPEQLEKMSTMLGRFLDKPVPEDDGPDPEDDPAMNMALPAA